MAVANPQDSNLSSSYANIINALRSQTEIAGNKPPSTLGLLAGVAGKAAGAYVGAKVANKLESDQEKDMLDFKARIQDDLQRNSEKYKAQGEGKILVRPDDVRNYYASQGIDPRFSPAESIPEDGIYITTDYLPTMMKEHEFSKGAKNLSDYYAQEYQKSNKPEDLEKSKFLGLVAQMTPEQLKNSNDTLLKAIMPSTSKNSDKRYIRSVLDKRTNETSYYDFSDPEKPILLYSTGPESPEKGEKRKFQNLNASEQSRVMKSKERFLARPVIKDIESASSVIGEIRSLLNENPAGAGGLIKTKMVALSGQSPAKISDKDITLNEPNPDARAKLLNAYEQLTTGKLSEENVARYKKIADIMESKLGQKFNESLDSEYKSLATTIPNADQDDVKMTLSGTMSDKIGYYFNSIKDAENAKLPKGTMIYINGRKAVVE